MKHLTFIGILLAAALVLGACSPATPATGFPTVDIGTEVPFSTPGPGLETGTPSASGTDTTSAPAGTGTPQAGTTGTPGIPVTGNTCETVTVQLSEPVAGGMGGSGSASTPSAGGTTATPGTAATDTSDTDVVGTPVVNQPFLVDCEGTSLYVFIQDTPNSGTSSCTDADECTSVWFPLTVDEGEEPQASEGIDESLLDTLPRDDGTLQVTYNGWALYTFNGDIKPGNTYGSGVNDMWFLISAEGEPIQ